MKSLFELAEVQLCKEIDNGKRDTYSLLEIVDYAVKIRKWLDSKRCNLQKILNSVGLTKNELRRKRYAITGK